MAKINASMADVSTSFEPFDPGVYVFKIREVKDKTEAGRTTYQVGLEVSAAVDGNENAVGRKMTHFISMHKTNGEINQYGLADLKRLFEACAPDEANSDDADTDSLIDGEFMAQVTIDVYQKRDAEGEPIGEPKRNNKLDSRSIQAV